MKKNDVILILVILAVALLFLLGMKWYQKNATKKQAYALVKIDGNEYGRYPLDDRKRQLYHQRRRARRGQPIGA